MKLFKRKLNLSKPKLMTCFGCLGVPALAIILLIVEHRLRNRPVHISIPAPIVIPVNARDDFLAAGTLALKIENAHKKVTDYMRDHSAADYAESERLFRSILVRIKPGLLKPYHSLQNRSPQWYYDGSSGEYNALRDALQYSSLHYELKGEFTRCVETQLDGLEFGAMISRGGSLMCAHNSLKEMRPFAYHLEWPLSKLTPNELAHVADRLDVIRSKFTPISSNCAEGRNEEMTRYLLALAKNRNVIDRTQDYAMAVHPISHGESNIEIFDIPNFFGSEMYDKQRLASEIDEYFRNCAVELDEPYHKPFRTRLPKHANVYVREENYEYLWSMQATEWSEVDLLGLEVALRRFKEERHKFPVTLTELSPKFLRTLPVDPFDTNKPYKYQLKPDGTYLLYGLGEDMADHHGTPGRFAGDKGFDLVAGHLARKFKLPTK